MGKKEKQQGGNHVVTCQFCGERIVVRAKSDNEARFLFDMFRPCGCGLGPVFESKKKEAENGKV